jgi:NADP-dependent 3-hydroxy acid dehydrogenase YdfG
VTAAPAALVVGATGGMGQLISAAVVAEGYHLSVTGRRQGEVQELSDRLTAAGGVVQPLVGDLLDPVACAALVSGHMTRFGRLDLVVNAAGATQRRLLAEIDVQRGRTVVEVNLTGTVALLAAALPALRQSARTRPGALVILLSSLVAANPVSGYALYSATKAAISSLARSVNEEEAANGIRATAIAPGFVDSAFTDGMARQPGEFLPASDIAEAVRFLLRLSPTARVPVLEISRTNAEAGRP